MSSEAQSIQKNHVEERGFLEKVKPYTELVAALASGVLIVTGWLLDSGNYSGISVISFVMAYFIGGFAKAKEGIESTIQKRDLNVEMLMILAAMGSAIIGYWIEGAILIFIFSLSGALETYTMNKSRKEISSLMDLQPEEALSINNGIEKKIPVADLQVGDLILVKPGERIPSDGNIFKGQSNIDESTITGESIPVSKGPDNEVFAGTVNLSGSIAINVTRKTSETLFHKIIELVQSAQSEKSPSQLFIEKFEGKYVKSVLLAVILMLFLPHYLLGWAWTETFYRAMILLVVASPCALAASIMPATLSAISKGARHGILFKGGVHLENLGNLNAIAFDKTGTLTKGKPEVTEIIIRDGMDQENIILKAASIENYSTHPLAQAIVSFGKSMINQDLLEPEELEDIPGWGIRAKIGGDYWKIGKADFIGIPPTDFKKEKLQVLSNQGNTLVFVQINNELVALFALKDVVREETKTAIDRLKQLGIFTIMLTGDSRYTASAIAAESHVDQFIAECLPEGKVEQVKKLKTKFNTVAMVGDGINDAPALATANIGIAMGGGTDVALETADVVLMKNDLPRIAEAIMLSKRMNWIIKQNIMFSITVIILLIFSNFFQILNLPYGVIGHEGSTILVILNSLRLLK